jgi:hypothetical protein
MADVGQSTVASALRPKLASPSPPRRSTRSAVRKSASPRKLPANDVVIWSLSDGGSVSPATSQTALPTKS